MRRFPTRHWRGPILLVASLTLIASGTVILWASTWKLPDVSAFGARKVTESTKIYDRTGKILLYDLNAGARRTVVSWSDISRNVKNATVAIEDSEFYEHRGVRLKAILRALLANLFSGGFSQGGSTITQQVVKNSLLTSEKTLTRKLKEWVLAWRLEQNMGKETILSLYLNEAPYGGTVYGIEEAAQTFLGKSARDLTIAESAYLAALPNAPTYYSPYGNHRDKLEERKNLVLRRMFENRFITQSEHETARAEKVTFLPASESGILAPHFVLYIRQYLEEKYGREELLEGGFRVTTTLDYGLEKKAEEIAKKYALENKQKFDAENASLVALDPKTGQILAMVGSRDYFDKEIEGNFNATLALRQPGSAFKPIVYAEAFEKGYTPETVVFDLPTEFSTRCNPDGTPKEGAAADECYKPEDYDGKYRGPMTLRDALAQSVNIPSIQVLYLAGLPDSLRLAKDMGIGTLSDVGRYGLTLVLGGGEVRLLDLAGAYGVFATDGQYRPPVGILSIEDKTGRAIESFEDHPERVLSEQSARKINDILSDNRARAPAFSERSPLYFPDFAVAAKTGTTNDYRDAWVLGYTPDIVVGAWAGNNDNRPMQKKVAAFIVAPLWNAFMKEALRSAPQEPFRPPEPEDLSLLPPILRGIWQGGKTYFVDKLSGARATEFTPAGLREERAVQSVHSTLYWIDKDAPRLPRQTPPETDPQFLLWEHAVRMWAAENNLTREGSEPAAEAADSLHKREYTPTVAFQNPISGSVVPAGESFLASVSVSSHFPIAKVDFFLNNVFVGSVQKAPWQVTLSLEDSSAAGRQNELKAVAADVVENRGEAKVVFTSPS